MKIVTNVEKSFLILRVQIHHENPFNEEFH